MALLLQDMVDDGVAVGVIAETNSSPDMRAVEAVLDLLGDDLAAALRVFPSAAAPSESDEDDWQDVAGVGVGTTLEQAVQQAQAKVCILARPYLCRTKSIQCATTLTGQGA